MVGYCRVCKIGTGEEDDVSIHRLPKDEKTKAIWFAFIGHEINVNSGICSKHFKQSDFIYKIYGDGIRRFLKQGAFPSIQFSSDIRENLKDELSEDINNCISSRTERDTDPEKNITIKEEQECIIIDETVIKAENSMEGDVQSISETEDPLTIMEHNTNLETSTVLGNEIQEFINIDETQINTNSTDMRREIDPLAIIKYDTDLKTNIILGNKIQESINIDETINTNSIDNQLERKTSNSLATRKRFHNVRYVGDLCRQDFTSDESWRLFKNYLASTKTKIKSLNHKIVYLNKKIDSLQKINCF